MKASAHPRVSKKPAKSTAAKSHARPAPTVREHAIRAGTAQPRSEEERFERIAQAAYFHAERRGFVPGQELNDWLAAESEIDGQPLLAHQLASSDT